MVRDDSAMEILKSVKKEMEQSENGEYEISPIKTKKGGKLKIRPQQSDLMPLDDMNDDLNHLMMKTTDKSQIEFEKHNK